MIISSLRLSNFRQYDGDQTIEFSTDPTRNVSIVTGANGTGKTGLFMALNWCLYGEGTYDAGDLIGRGLSDTERGSGAFVEVRFHHDGIQYVARRGVQPDRSGEEVGRLELLELRPGGRSRTVLNPEQVVNEILPIDARQYFFFDGERIDEMSRPGHEAQVREAIRSVLKIKVLERTIAHLDEVRKDYQRTIRAAEEQDDEVTRATDELEARAETIKGLLQNRDELRTEIEATDRLLLEVEDQMRSFEAFRSILIREAEIDTSLLGKEERSTEIVSDLAEIVERAGPCVARDALTIAQQILDEKRKRGEIPSGLRQQLVDDLLRDGACICGRSLDASARQELAKRRETATSGALEDTVLAAVGHIAALDGAASRIPSRLAEGLREYEAARDAMDELQREREGLRQQVSSQLETGDTRAEGDEPRRLDDSRRQLEQKARDLIFEQGQLEAGLGKLQVEQERQREGLQRMQAKGEAATRDKRRYELALLAHEAAKDLLTRFFSDMRQRIEETTDEIFRSLVWKKKSFEAVRLHEDSRLDVIAPGGISTLRGLSAGERQVLSLSFIVAMSRVTGEEAPLVIDTPFGRISETPLHNIADSLPHISGQLVLLVTDRELDDAARRAMGDKIGAEYVLDFDDDSHKTTIREV